MASGLLGCLPDVPTWVVGDRGFASDAFRERIWAMGARPAIPPRRTDAEVACPDWIYANHRLVENLWTRLKEWRAIAIHYEKTASMDASSPSWSGSASTTLWHLDAAEQGASTPSGERALKLVGRSMHMAN
ncbi:Transposase DDE domain-containing protein [Belnapia rosea]|uniref:Transposase DDE domain-containing protein n=1 Tax=Belnapia rosea TaxID=938405 RepID=A0A1G6YWD9_9PROT|nr:Transposase DDE domain-containing protein [Belnapia rosea]